MGFLDDFAKEYEFPGEEDVLYRINNSERVVFKPSRGPYKEILILAKLLPIKEDLYVHIWQMGFINCTPSIHAVSISGYLLDRPISGWLSGHLFNADYSVPEFNADFTKLRWDDTERIMCRPRLIPIGRLSNWLDFHDKPVNEMHEIAEVIDVTQDSRDAWDFSYFCYCKIIGVQNGNIQRDVREVDAGS